MSAAMHKAALHKTVLSASYCRFSIPAIHRQHAWTTPLRNRAKTGSQLDSSHMVAAISYESAEPGQDLDPSYGIPGPGAPKNRRAGIILHPTSLPGPYGTGEIGQEAFRFIDWLEAAGMQVWQVLPLVPPETEFWSPYSGLDGLCGNELLIDIETLISYGLLDQNDRPPRVPVGNAKFDEVRATKVPLLAKASERLTLWREFEGLRGEMRGWRSEHAWVEESALFSCLTRYEPELKDKAWWTWPEPIRKHEAGAVQAMREKYGSDIDRFVALQFLFDKQWQAIKAYANSKGIRLVGDMPIYVGGQSADVWAYQGLFELSASGAPAMVSGVPPDAFSETGQLWGSPLYDWKAHKANGYQWWVQRLKRAFQLYDETRIDHFRGFAGYWAVDAKAETAMVGAWKKGPGTDLFDVLSKELGDVPIIAEDLGVITPDVVALREAIGAPGMVVLQFAWGGGPTNTHLPHNHYENCVCYPGTHDNETAVGWWADSADPNDREMLQRYLSGADSQDIAGLFIAESMKSVAKTSIFLMQDVLRLDNSARMNSPGTTANNWGWRIGDADVWGRLQGEAAALRELARTYDRLAPEARK